MIGGTSQAGWLSGLALWSFDRRDETPLRESLTQLRQLAALPDTVLGQANAEMALLMMDALEADRQDRRDVGAAIARLDSAARDVGGSQLMASAANLVAARLWEKYGNRRNALDAVRRREYFYLFSPYFLTTYLREEGRLAELTGDREGAIKAYSHYLAMRYNPEPAWQADADRVRAALERLKRESAGR